MSIFDYTASIVLIFDKTIANTTISTDGWTVTGYEPYASPGGPLVETSYSIKRIDKLTDTSIKIWLTQAGRMKYPQGLVTVGYTKALGDLAGPYSSLVDDFEISFTPTGIVPVFNPNGIEHLSAQAGISLAVGEIAYLYNQSDDEHLSAQASITLVVTKVGDLPL